MIYSCCCTYKNDIKYEYYIEVVHVAVVLRMKEEEACRLIHCSCTAVSTAVVLYSKYSCDGLLLLLLPL